MPLRLKLIKLNMTFWWQNYQRMLCERHILYIFLHHPPADLWWFVSTHLPPCAPLGSSSNFLRIVLKQRRIDAHLLQVMLNTCTSAEFLTIGLYWVAALWDAIPPVPDSQCLTLSSAMLKMHRWLRVPLPQSSEQRRRRKNSASPFFQLMKQMFGIPLSTALL